MTDSPPRLPNVDIAIIGGGAAGVLAAIHLLRQAVKPLRLALLVGAGRPGEGVAYATPFAEHLLNVPAGRMSAFPDDAGDFVAWLESVSIPVPDDGHPLADRFVERRLYAQYLQARLDEARGASVAQLAVLASRVIGIDQADLHATLDADGTPLRLRLAGGGTLGAWSAILAVGNARRDLPLADGESAADGVVSAWDFAAVAGIGPDEEVAIIGSGLSMVDTVLSLARNRHRAPIHVLSRHALLPLPHAGHGKADIDPESLGALPLRGRMHQLRAWARDALAAGAEWQSVFEAVRPQVRVLWGNLSHADQRRFLRHAVRYWDVHRHRIAPGVHAQVMALVASGQLRRQPARVRRLVAEDGRLRIFASARGGAPFERCVDRVVNATGLETRVERMHDPLLAQLLNDGLALPGPHGLGLDTASDGDLVGAGGGVNWRIFVIGSLRIGRLFETTAVPELRAQAALVARQLLARS